MKTHASISGKVGTEVSLSALAIIRETVARTWVACIGFVLAGCWLYLTFIAVSRTLGTIQVGGLDELTWWGVPHIVVFTSLALVAVGDVMIAVVILVRGDTRLTIAHESKYDWEDRLTFNLVLWFTLAVLVGLSLATALGVTYVLGDMSVWQVAFAYDQRDVLQWSVWHLQLFIPLCAFEALWQGVIILARSR